MLFEAYLQSGVSLAVQKCSIRRHKNAHPHIL
jgi:hypothetical protein